MSIRRAALVDWIPAIPRHVLIFLFFFSSNHVFRRLQMRPTYITNFFRGRRARLQKRSRSSQQQQAVLASPMALAFAAGSSSPPTSQFSACAPAAVHSGQHAGFQFDHPGMPSGAKTSTKCPQQAEPCFAAEMMESADFCALSANKFESIDLEEAALLRTRMPAPWLEIVSGNWLKW